MHQINSAERKIERGNNDLDVEERVKIGPIIVQMI